MKSLILKEPGEEPDLQVVDAPEPILVPDGVIIKVAAAGVCHHDISVMDGTLRRGTKKNVVLGHEISGIVVDTGAEVSDIRIGEKVVTTLTSSCGICSKCIDGNDYMCEVALGYGHGIDGGFAEYVMMKSHNVVKVGDLDLVQSALLSCPIGVNVKAILDVASLSEDDTCVVFGSSGGLGIHAMQIMQNFSNNVIGFTSSPSKLDEFDQYGIASVFLLEEGFPPSELVMALTDDKGASLVFNPIGTNFLENSIDCLGYAGKVLLMGELSKKDVVFRSSSLLFKNGMIMGSTGANRSHIQSAAEMVNSGELVPVVGGEFSFGEVLEAFHSMKTSSSIGRLVLVP